MKQAKLISSLDNPLIKRIKSLLDGGSKANKARSETNLAIIEGIHLAQAWLGSEDLVELFTTEEGMSQSEISAVINTQLAVFPQTDLYVLDASLWKKITDLGNAPPIMASIRISNHEFPMNFNDDVLVLDAIQIPLILCLCFCP